jgi:hypothetical protein
MSFVPFVRHQTVREEWTIETRGQGILFEIYARKIQIPKSANRVIAKQRGGGGCYLTDCHREAVTYVRHGIICSPKDIRYDFQKTFKPAQSVLFLMPDTDKTPRQIACY